ncbi:YceI family protein [Tenacibaculum sp. 190524A02b]|uniref:YceI family protein n=1 Tax=Tenacibaculum vairaonense TaxID=3137860 RepID=A0ABP1FE01_9FLAO
MKKILLLLTVLSFINMSEAQTLWKVDKAHSSITFSVSHFMISEVTGNFGGFDITANSNEKFESPTFEVTINASTINTNQKGRDNHLKSSDFLEVTKYPNVFFKSTTYKQLEKGQFEVKGNLTIKNITREAVFKGNLNGIINGSNGKKKAGLKLSTIVKREEFNLGTGMNPIGKDISVIVNIEMNQQ